MLSHPLAIFWQTSHTRLSVARAIVFCRPSDSCTEMAPQTSINAAANPTDAGLIDSCPGVCIDGCSAVKCIPGNPTTCGRTAAKAGGVLSAASAPLSEMLPRNAVTGIARLTCAGDAVCWLRLSI